MTRKLRLHLARRTYAAVALLALAAGAFAVTSPILSEVVTHDLPPIAPAAALNVSGLPDAGHAGDVFRVTAVVRNNANRPLPAVLRMDVRNVNTTISPGDITIYASCGAEEVASTRTLRYYLGRHGPLLAPNGSAFQVETTVAAIETALGSAAHWEVVLHELQGRDPKGYASLISPGNNASEGPRTSSSVALKALYYFGMVSSAKPWSGNPADWILVVPFADTWSPTDGRAPGFLLEIAPTVHGGFAFKLWAELPDVLGLPNHPGWNCGPL